VNQNERQTASRRAGGLRSARYRMTLLFSVVCICSGFISAQPAPQKTELLTLTASQQALVAANAILQDDGPLIAPSSNLSSAMAAGEWSRVEGAVDRGLAWLSSQQEKDGRFPSDADAAQPAVTSLAIMAFLSRGHIPDQGRYGRQLTKAIEFVLTTRLLFAAAGHSTGSTSVAIADCHVQPCHRRSDAG